MSVAGDEDAAAAAFVITAATAVGMFVIGGLAHASLVCGDVPDGSGEKILTRLTGTGTGG